MSNLSGTFKDHIIPVVSAFILINVIGFLGNLSVLGIFTLRYPRTRFRCLVIALAVVDLTSCCTTVPLETVSTWYWFHAPSRGVCKAKNFFVQLTALSAMFMLFVTAVYKYLRICKPFKKQLSQKLIIIMCVAGTFSSTVFAIPAAFLWDVNNHTRIFNNVSENVYVCEVHRSFAGTFYPTLYRIVLSGYNIYLIITVVLYTLVARTIILHVRQLKQWANTSSTSSNSDFSTVSELVVNRQNSRNTTQSSRLSATQIRKIIIMVIVAGTFSVTFVMGLAFGYVFALRSSSDYSSLTETVVFFACYRIYFINYALNPIIYFSLDKRFRAEVINTLYLCRFTKPSVYQNNSENVTQTNLQDIQNQANRF